MSLPIPLPFSPLSPLSQSYLPPPPTLFMLTLHFSSLPLLFLFSLSLPPALLITSTLFLPMPFLTLIHFTPIFPLPFLPLLSFLPISFSFSYPILSHSLPHSNQSTFFSFLPLPYLFILFFLSLLSSFHFLCSPFSFLPFLFPFSPLPLPLLADFSCHSPSHLPPSSSSSPLDLLLLPFLSHLSLTPFLQSPITSLPHPHIITLPTPYLYLPSPISSH